MRNTAVKTGSCMPFFSVITVCKNAAATLQGTIESLHTQRSGNWEWIVVDGGSTDGTLELLKKTRSTRTKIVSEQDGGIYAAMNKGVRMAEGEFIHFLNADDRYADSTVLEDVEEYLARHRDCDFAYGSIKVSGPNGAEDVWEPPPPEWAPEEMIYGCLPHQGSFSRRRLFYDQLGFFDESLCTAADYLWMTRASIHPAVRMDRMNRLIACYNSAGVSSNLAKALPESHRALNEEAGFWSRVPHHKAIGHFQRQCKMLRMALADARR